ncbi:endo alpha-1,4 polygalactosaminidase [Thermus igniterrae]|uniref:endo alpha-1,4 polygalactosaminidase n=1 Tax=Thermus igniterrae TaxID=88189 RepID=UPI0012EA7E04|nr:endo alpha-1,4 polygalactosaminidase [Thermus igniterrae]
MLRILLALLTLGGLALAQRVVVAQALPRPQGPWGVESYPGLPVYSLRLTTTYPPETARFPGSFQVAYDGEALYVLARLEQEAPPKAERGPDDPEWWQDDTLEVFLRWDPFDEEAPDLHLAVNPKGVRFRRYTAPLSYEARTGTFPGGWWAALRIPFGEALPPPKPGSLWQLKVGRGHPSAQEYTLWPMGGSFHSPGNYGYLVFLQAPQDLEALTAEVRAREAALPPIPSRLQGLKRWALYYGGDPKTLARLRAYDLVVLAREAPLDLVRGLKEGGTKVVAYLPLGVVPQKEAEARGWQHAALGPNPYAPDALLMDPASPAWRAYVRAEAARLLALGFEGFFLDGLDLADLYPEKIPALAALVRGLRQAEPGALFLQHRGFRVLRRTARYLDGVVYSGLSLDAAGRPSLADPSPVWPFRSRGLPALSLDVAPSLEAKAWAEQRALELGFLPYVALGGLTEFP